MSERLYVSTRKGLFTFQSDAGGQWMLKDLAFVGDPVLIISWDGRTRKLYAALGHGHFGPKLHCSADGGRTWCACAVPAYPRPPEDAEPDRCPLSGIEIPWRLIMIWYLEPAGSDEPGVLWCGTLPGGLFKSCDDAASWQLVRGLWDCPQRKRWFGGGYDTPGIHSICVDPRCSQHVTVGVSCGGVWVSEDGGRSWQCRGAGMWANYMPPEQQHDGEIQDPHRLVQCRAKPDHFWVQHHNGIFRTTDGAAHWKQIDQARPSTFGFAAATDPFNPDTAWFVPAVSDEKRVPVDGRLVVTRMRDGGKTFDVLRAGLPQEDAYHITLRHALDVDDSGRCVAFGSTTGGLWLSQDQGDTWQCLKMDLPPVYSVRFA